MRLPKSLRPVAHLIAKHATSMSDISVKQPVPATMQVPGTRAFAGQGTMAEPGTNSADQIRYTGSDASQFDYGDGPEVPNAQGNKTVYPWPANPARWEENPGGGRSFIMRTDAMLQAGPPPGRILRQMYDRNLGMNGAATGEPYGDGGSLPNPGSTMYLQHMQVPRYALGTKGPQKLSDDNAAIPAIFAGNPRP